MTAAFDDEYEELHRLVDGLPVERVRALRTVALSLIAEQPENDGAEPAQGERRRLSFAGLMEAEADLATRSEEILRAEFGRPVATLDLRHFAAVRPLHVESLDLLPE